MPRKRIGKTLSITIPFDVLDELNARAEQHGQSIPDVVRFVLNDWLECLPPDGRCYRGDST